jgi:hypothetical protein
MTHDGGHTWAGAALPPVMEVTGGGGYLYALAEPSSRPASVWRTHDWLERLVTDLHAVHERPVPGLPTERRRQRDRAAAEGRDGARSGLKRGSLVMWTSDDAGSEWVERRVPCTSEDGGAAVVSLAYGHPHAWLIDCFDNEQSSQEQQTQHHLYGSANAGEDWVRLADRLTPARLPCWRTTALGTRFSRPRAADRIGWMQPSTVAAPGRCCSQESDFRAGRTCSSLTPPPASSLARGTSLPIFIALTTAAAPGACCRSRRRRNLPSPLLCFPPRHRRPQPP